MQITIASGKGGTGKTTIATSFSLSLIGEMAVAYLDCDVEAPNGHLFLNPWFLKEVDAVIQIPRIDPAKCTLCGKCVDCCQFHALANNGKKIMLFPQLCHGCGLCSWICPLKAIEEFPNPIGLISSGFTNEGIHFYQGKLTISEPMPTPIIRQMKKKFTQDSTFNNQTSQNSITILDAPPGASCSVVESLRGSDFALLVTEPTPFGLHDLKQMSGILEDMKIPFGVVINRDGIGDNQMELFLKENHYPILVRIPFSTDVATGIAAGKRLIDILPEYRDKLRELLRAISTLISDNLSEG